MAIQHARRGQRGTSLIEIMVVLVIVLVGLFLAIRIFPIGFGVLRSNANRTTATQLADNMMSLVRGQASALPDGVLYASTRPSDEDNNNFTLSTFTNISNDNLGPCYVDRAADLPCTEDRTKTEVDNAYFTDINKFRFIKGEAVKVPLPTPDVYSAGALYTLKFGPVFMDKTVGSPANAPLQTDATQQAFYNSYLHVYSAPFIGQAVTIPDDAHGGPGSLVNLIRDGRTYLIDYGNDTTPVRILLPPRAGANRAVKSRTFTVTLSFELNGKVVTQATDPVVVPDDSTDFQTLTVGGTAITGAVPGSETVVRDFVRLASATAFDLSDPYQYKLVSSNVPTGEGITEANMGIISFNPAGASLGSASSSNLPFTAYVDYAVLDWHIIRDDREVPSVLPMTAQSDAGGTVNLIPVRTTLRAIKRVGQPEADDTFYPGIYGNTAGPNTEANPKDFQLYTLGAQTDALNRVVPVGAPLNASTLYSQGNTLRVTTNNAYYYMIREVKNKPGASISKDSSYATGVIYINANLLRPGTKIRMLYKGVGDWGVGVQKAYARYAPLFEADGAPSPLPKPGAFNGFAQFKAKSGSALTGQLRFPYSDLNKSVVVTLQYITMNNGTPVVKRLAPVQMTLDKAGVDKTANAAQYDQRYAYANVQDYIPLLQKAEFTSADDWQVVGQVNGVSVKTRVVWHDDETPNERWHVQDMDSFVSGSVVQ